MGLNNFIFIYIPALGGGWLGRNDDGMLTNVSILFWFEGVNVLDLDQDQAKQFMLNYFWYGQYLRATMYSVNINFVFIPFESLLWFTKADPFL